MSKRKANRKPIQKIKGFTLNRKTGHVSWAFWQKDKNVMSLGFTHNSGQKYEKKTKLKHNINQKDKTPCYVKHTIEEHKFNNYKKKPEYLSYRIHTEDKPTIDAIIKNGLKNKKR